MRSHTVLVAVIAAACLGGGTAHAQRAEENAVRTAEDAFGSTVGRESIGLYSPDDVRGFSAVTAGNLRIGGLYFDQQAAPTSHLIASANMRVGLAAQGFAFPAPTGIVDYDLRTPTGARALSLIASGTSWGGYSLETDGQTAITDTLAIGFGGGLYRDKFGDDTKGDYSQAAVIARWRPLPKVEIIPFYEWAPVHSNPATAIYVTADGAPPAWLPRDYHGPRWDAYRGLNQNAGLVAGVVLGPDTSLRLGGFRSTGTSRSTFASLFLGLAPDGQADHVIVADPKRRYISDSAEIRLAQGFAEGPRRHLLIASLRGRTVDSRYGGSEVFDFGQVAIDAPSPAVEPTPHFTAVTDDQVHQWSAGLAYSLAWEGLGDASIGLMHTDYRKRVAAPGLAIANVSDAPLLWNASAAFKLTPTLLVYASHTLGLEEAGQAPDAAVNRGALTQAIRTQQSDAGLRWKPTPGLSLVAGVFEVKKPYDAIDGSGVFRRLGALANRGVELSFTGQPVPEWTVVAGAVLLDAVVSGDEVRTGAIGRRPVNSTPIKTQANVEYAPRQLKAWSFDAGLNWRDRVVATNDGRSHLPARATLDLGLRYRFLAAGNSTVLRAQVTNVANTGGYVVLGPGAYKLADDRKAFLSLAADF